MATTTIYLSSTYEDLKEYRQAVFESLRKSQYNIIAMEDYVATDQRPADKCLKDVERADIYVGLFGFRYGYIPPASHDNTNGWSITELEFRHAEHLQKPCLTFLADAKQAGIPQQFVDAFTGDGEGGKQIKRLREYLAKERTASFFSNPYQLASLVQSAVTSHLANNPKPEFPTVSEAPVQSVITWDIEKQDSPYPGLLHFTRKYAPVFFGRDAETREILDRMRGADGRFMLLSGDSGIGKSSVVAAGVLPLIEETPLPGSKRPLCIRMIPGKGPHPFSALMGALHPYATAAGLDPESIEKELIQSPQSLSHHVRAILSKGGEHDALVLFLDQMEELFTAHDPEASKAFLHALYEAAQEGALWVLATIRSDHLHHCHGHPDMLRLLRGKGHYPLGPIEPFMLADLIAKPARCAGLKISDSLVRRIVHESLRKADDPTMQDQSNLPLLAFLLNQLFEQRTDHELSQSVYEQLGGIKGAIDRHAATVEKKIKDEHGATTAALLPTLLQSLVIVNAKGLPTRRRPLRSDFPSEMNNLIGTLVQERLLHSEGEGKGATVSLSHEALFEAWPSLREYVTKNSKQLMDQSLLDSRARKWKDMGRPRFTGLAFGREYTDFARAGGAATELTKEYLHASLRARWIQMAVIAVVVLVVGGTGAWLWKEGLPVEDAFLTAQSQVMNIHTAPQMVTIAGGTFRQGDTHNRGDASEEPVREVRITQFAMGKYEVTFDEYKRFTIATKRPLPHDQGWGRGRRPVLNVSWDDAKVYAEWLSGATGKRYRLPTESEWEYAARSIAKNKDDIWAGTSEEAKLKDYAVYGGGRTEPVGSKNPNSLGLHDMSGNVWEWVEDCWHENYKDAPTDGSVWLEAGGGKCGRRATRGGSWGNDPEYLRASNRFGDSAGLRDGLTGFRLVQDID